MPANKKDIDTDEDGFGPLAHESGEGRIDLAAGAGVEDLDLQSHSAGGRLHDPQRGFRSRSIGRIDEHGDTSRSGHYLTQEFQPLCGQLTSENIDPRQVAFRSGKAGHKTEPDWVFAGEEHDGNRSGCRLGSDRRSIVGRGDYGDLSADQFGRQLRQSIELILGPAVFDRHVPALDVAAILQALAKCAQTVRHPVRRSGVEKSNYRHRRLLRRRDARGQNRGCSPSAAEQRDELPASHSITLSATASSLSGTTRSSMWAAWALMTSSNLFACTTGKSTGFAPLRMRPA